MARDTCALMLQSTATFAGAGERVTSDPVERSIRIHKRDHEECEGNEHLAAQDLILDSFGPLNQSSQPSL